MNIRIARISRSSWFKINTESKIIHIDPGYAGYFENQGIPIYELEEKSDIILVTHDHKDHLQPKALELIYSHETQLFAPAKCVKNIKERVTIVKPGDEFELDGITIKPVHAYNTPEGNSTRKVHHKGDFVGYLLSVAGKIIYHAGDTDLIPEMEQLGMVDVALLPIGGKFTMDIDEAVKAVEVIKPKIVIPMHCSTANPSLYKEKLNVRWKVNVEILQVGEAKILDV